MQSRFHTKTSQAFDLLKEIGRDCVGAIQLLGPEFKEVDVPLLGRMQVSKQVISLQNDNGTSYDLYIQVQNELAAAYTELRDELAMQKFGMSYKKIEEMAKSEDGAEKFGEMIDAIRDVYPQRISEAEPKDIGG